MIENGQVWASGGRTISVLAKEGSRVIVRDSYGWRRSLTEDELKHGFSDFSHRVEAVRGVMARRTLADIQPA